MPLSDSILPQSPPPILRRALVKVTGFDQLERLYQNAASDNLIDSVLNALEVRCEISTEDKRRFPNTGPAVVVANHPTGMLDGLVMASILLGVRSDVKILGNAFLCAAPELSSILIPIDLSNTRAAVRQNSVAMRQALKHLLGGGMLLVFPAGEVSRLNWRLREASDAQWSTSIPRLIRSVLRTLPRLQVIAAHLSGANSTLFHLAGAISSQLQLAMLPRELLNKKGSVVRVAVGRPLDASRLIEFGDDRECGEYLRWRTQMLGNRPAFKAQTSVPLRRKIKQQPGAIIDAVSRALMRDEIDALPLGRKLSESGDLAVYLAASHEAPNVLTEISRLREITFRAAGEGTGRACDRDQFDDHYQHLFVWNHAKEEIAGAYRLARTSDVSTAHGIGGLYTATLFFYTEAFLEQLGPAIELGRSFIRAEYQRAFTPLLLLWKGIGSFVASHPECRILFGPVSISSQYQNISRELMVAFLKRRAPLTELLGFVSSRSPFRASCAVPAAASQRLEVEDLSSVIADIEPDGRGVPVLLRQYLKLGGRLLGFNVDPDFSNTLDGLIVVDLLRTERGLLERYLGKDEAEALLTFHKEGHAA